eukprot:PLAT4460.1.p1 GENE.PLAT4460.1~~PLAT4460.1.p1  ORF type:complete len:220 (+),score=90.94 PLAT4460.1:39-662(+)
MADAEAIRFLALGDSYTIGEGVAEEERWPVLLAKTLREAGCPLGEPRIIARTGWKSFELDAAIDEAGELGEYGFVTLLIGVNDQYNAIKPEDYRPHFVKLLKRAIGFAGGDAGRVCCVSIPDWGITQFAAASGRDIAVIAAEIDAFNAVNKAEAEAAGVAWADITPLSREQSELLAADGLHPSGEAYAAWVADVIAASAKRLLVAEE